MLTAAPKKWRKSNGFGADRRRNSQQLVAAVGGMTLIALGFVTGFSVDCENVSIVSAVSAVSAVSVVLTVCGRGGVCFVSAEEKHPLLPRLFIAALE